jgi:putative transposase
MGLEIKIASWRGCRRAVSRFDLMKQLVDIKDVEWIADVPSQTLQNSIDRLDRSYQNFFRSCHSGGGFLKFAKKRKYKSITFKSVSVINNTIIKLPKIGELKMFKDSPIIGTPKTAQIIKEPTGYFVCIQCDMKRNISNPDENQVIGIDMGIAHFCVDSNGKYIKNEKHFAKYERQLRIENRALARKKLYSNHWKRQSKKLALLHHKISNVRMDFLHKESTKMAKLNNTVVIEDLKIVNMVRNHHLSKHILDCGWGYFKGVLEYKTNVIKVDPKYTSQTCSECGSVDAASRISQSEFVCTHCGYMSNADVNAAKNILGRGMAFIRQREAVACA